MFPTICCTDFISSLCSSTPYTPLKLFLGLRLSASGAIIKHFTKDNHISKDYGYTGLGTQGRMWTKQHGAALLGIERSTEETDI